MSIIYLSCGLDAVQDMESRLGLKQIPANGLAVTQVRITPKANMCTCPAAPRQFRRLYVGNIIICRLTRRIKYLAYLFALAA